MNQRRLRWLELWLVALAISARDSGRTLAAQTPAPPACLAGGAVRSTGRLPHLRAQGDNRDPARRLDGGRRRRSPSSRSDKGVWEGTTEPLPPDFYSYSFTVDGVRTLDARNALIKQGVTQHRQHVLRAWPGGGVRRHRGRAARRHPQGLVSRRPRSAASGACTSTRRRATTAAKDRYPVLYLLHGGGDEDSGWSTIGRAGFIVDNLLASGKVRPLIVVMPNGSLPRPANFPTTPPGAAPTPKRWPQASPCRIASCPS